MLALCCFALLFGSGFAAFVCSSGYACAQDPASNTTVWAMKLDGNTNGPSCKTVCENALGAQSTSFYSCDKTRSTYPTAAAFAPIANLLGFRCAPGSCWNSVAPGAGLQLVSIASTPNASGLPSRECYFPTEPTFSCTNDPGNANCFNQRYISVCPCQVKALEEACEWDCPNFPRIAKFATVQDGSCLARINYWRKRACDENWVECPPAGLPPMTECTGCNRCGNSEAQYDSINGAHKSFRRCGELVQGSGGGSNCAGVIDQFVSERTLINGTMRCQGHCGPILVAGCQTFFFGHFGSFGTGAAGSYVLNWRSCGAACDNYCNNPNSNACFSTPVSPNVTTYQNCSRDTSVTSSAAFLTSSLLLLLLVFIQ